MNAETYKREAAAGALDFVKSGMRLGLGTGSTARPFVELLGDRVRAGLDIIAVPTSEATRIQAEQCGIPLTTLDETPELDLTIDGADEIAPDLALIKGGGGALLREKIVASASARMVVIADDSKWVAMLGQISLAHRGRTFRPGCDEARRGGRERSRRPVPARSRCERTKPAMLSSRTAAISSLMRRCNGSPIRARWGSGWRPFRELSNTGFSSGSPMRP